MTNSPTNPYAPTSVPIGLEMPVPMDPASLAKVKAIIKDARQFWIAILLCLLCWGPGSLIIGIWYFVRLLQWSALAKNQPFLMEPNVAPGSLAANFQGAKIKLIIGLIFGVFILLCVLAFVALLMVVGEGIDRM